VEGRRGSLEFSDRLLGVVYGLDGTAFDLEHKYRHDSPDFFSPTIVFIFERGAPNL
jgi:hypothetical protein